MSFSFVTSYFEFNKDNTDEYFNYFYKLADLNFPIICYLDAKLNNRLTNANLKKYNKVFSQFIDISKLPLSQDKDLVVPEDTDKNKLIAENSKVYL